MSFLFTISWPLNFVHILPILTFGPNIPTNSPILVEWICDWGVHFWKEAWHFALQGFEYADFKQLQEPTVQKFKIQNGHPKPFVWSITQLEVPQLPWSRSSLAIYPCFGIQWDT